MTSESTPDTWAAFAGMPREDGAAAMGERFTALAGADAASRDAEITAILEAECALDSAGLATLAAMRLRALATLPVEDAVAIQASWDKAERSLPAEQGMRRVSALQAACKGLSLDEVSKVEAYLPSAREMAGLGPAPTRRAEPVAVVSEEPRRGLLRRLFSRS